MPKVGDEKYPELSVESAVEIADVLVNQYGGEAKSEEAFAQSLGHSSSNSGSYLTKVADVRRYGLIQSRGLQATDLAYQAANPRDDQELAEAKFKVYRNIDVLSEIYDSLNGNDPPEDFWRVISEVTGANPKDARDAEKTMEKLYDGMREAEKEAQKSRKDAEHQKETEESSAKSSESTIAGQAEGAAIYVRIGNEELRLSETSDMYIDLAREFLERMKSKSQSDLEGDSDENKGEEDKEDLEQMQFSE